MKGFEDGTFRPDDPVSREEVAAMISRALRAAGKSQALTVTESESVLSIFSDRDGVSGWAASDLAQAVKEGIVAGQKANVIAPRSSATRAEAVTMISRFWRR